VFEGLMASGAGQPSDFSKTEEWIDQGYRTAREALDSYDEATKARTAGTTRGRSAAAIEKARKGLRR
jgi:hypothetical protein